MKIVAAGLSFNEADIITECVSSALKWADAFVLYDSSVDNTAWLAEQAGAQVIKGDPEEEFNEALRQHTLDMASDLDADWIVRTDPDEFYPYGARWPNSEPQDMRHIIAQARARGEWAIRADVVQFWVTLDDMRRGFILEDERAPVQQRRRWYSVGHTAVAAWRHDPRFQYKPGEKKNLPFCPDGRDVGAFAREPLMIQTHYTCRSWPQMWGRVIDRRRNKAAFGKYQKNLVIDEAWAGLHYWDGGPFAPQANHDNVYRWFEKADALYVERGL